ncbi:MAG: response regulator transcription factor [Coprobacillaceae bacterium]
MKKILVIEDEVDIQEILCEFLKEKGYLVSSANDGVEGISMFHSDTYDLVLLDIMMPKIDGYGVLETIRKNSNIPVIMITAMYDEESQIKGFDLEADDYIVKPFSMNLVMKRIEAVLRRNQSQNKDNRRILQYNNISLDLIA